jgi:SAM-dependent methyltransferase
MPGPSDWITRWAGLIAPGGTVLDLACGSGRHLRWLAGQGLRVTGVDRNAEALAPLASLAEVRVADLEDGPWPLVGRRFDAVVVTNYLWRPRFGDLLTLLADDGVLLYETFADGNAALGRPARPTSCSAAGNCWACARVCASSPSRKAGSTIRRAACSASPPWARRSGRIESCD